MFTRKEIHIILNQWRKKKDKSYHKGPVYISDAFSRGRQSGIDSCISSLKAALDKKLMDVPSRSAIEVEMEDEELPW